MSRDNFISKLKTIFKTLTKSDRYRYIDKYNDFLPILDTYIERFTDTDISIDFPTSSMLHMNIPKYLYKKYSKNAFTKKQAENGYLLRYEPKSLNLYITYNREGRLDSNITVKVGRMLTDYVINNTIK